MSNTRKEAEPLKPTKTHLISRGTEAEREVDELRGLWLSRLMFNQFVGWAPETRSFDQFLDDHAAAFTPRTDGFPFPQIWLEKGSAGE